MTVNAIFDVLKLVSILILLPVSQVQFRSQFIVNSAEADKKVSK